MKNRILFISMLVAISVFTSTNFFNLYVPESPVARATPIAKAVTDDYWKGTTDSNIAQIQKDIGLIKADIKDICRDVTDIQIQAAKTGTIYGGGAGLGAYIVGLLTQLIFRKKEKKG